MDGCLYNVGSSGSKVRIPLPPEFKISIAEKFARIGDPKQHIRRYIIITKIKGLDDKQTLYAFPLSIQVAPQGGTTTWMQARPKYGMS